MSGEGPASRRAGAASVALRGVSKRYGETRAVRNVSFTVGRGEFFTLLGPSGCGKTTALRMIAGFIEPDEGEIFIDDEPVAGVPPWERDLGLVFQSYALWPHLSVFEHVAFGLRERRLPRDEIRARVADALRMVNLEGLEERRPSQLSGGQQQRVALARTLVLRPRALLLDEPLSNLDAALRAQMRVELRRLHRELGITTLFVTHDQQEAMALSTRIAVFERGMMVQLGTPVDVYRRPRTRFVAEFLGAALDSPEGSPVVCIIRPEAIQRAAPDARVPNRFFVRMATVVYLGGRYDCEVAFAGGLTLRAEMLAVGGEAAPAPGELLTVVIPAEDVIVLPD
jgi:ABC-type Fe3+/spermidine/putrescine transport system ATPase subunit